MCSGQGQQHCLLGLKAVHRQALGGGMGCVFATFSIGPLGTRMFMTRMSSQRSVLDAFLAIMHQPGRKHVHLQHRVFAIHGAPGASHAHMQCDFVPFDTTKSTSSNHADTLCILRIDLFAGFWLLFLVADSASRGDCKCENDVHVCKTEVVQVHERVPPSPHL